MFPILFKIGRLTIHTYGVMIALGLAVSMRYLVLRARKAGIADNTAMDIVLYGVLAGIAGARITYILLNLSFYIGHPLDIVKIWEGGLVFYGGFITGAAAIIVYIRRNKPLRVLHVADLMAPSIALAHFFGRLGCFFAGCCYGGPLSLPWAVCFRNPSSLAPLGIDVHPVQLYEAAGNLAIFVFLDRYSNRKHVEGFVFGIYLILYAVLRFVIEFFRGDERGQFLSGFSPSQIMSIIILIAGAVILFTRKNKYAN